MSSDCPQIEKCTDPSECLQIVREMLRKDLACAELYGVEQEEDLKFALTFTFKQMVELAVALDEILARKQ
jgi:hypothetical protein